MQQSDLLDTLFLNKKALAGVGGAGADSGAAGANQTQTAKAAAAAAAHSPTTTTTTTTTAALLSSSSSSSTSTMSSGGDKAGSADVCPVDHNSREAWLKQAKAAAAADAAQQQQQQQPPTPQHPAPSWTSAWRIPFFSTPPTPQPPSHQHQQSQPPASLTLNREVSTIPRSTPPPGAAPVDTACPINGTGTGDGAPAPAPAANSEAETGADAATGNWVYPSEKMFFDAMQRKGHAARAADMKTVVPIHNAVNERAWVEIKAWERPYEAGTCPGGPRLYSFTGLSSKMSPKARLNTLLGYTPPFDRHDWVVDRCGTRVEYVIDFYTGKVDKHGRPSFYLDVRPKLNSWEGAKMRASRILGLV